MRSSTRMRLPLTEVKVRRMRASGLIIKTYYSIGIGKRRFSVCMLHAVARRRDYSWLSSRVGALKLLRDSNEV